MFNTLYEIEFAGETFNFRSHRNNNKNVDTFGNKIIYRSGNGAFLSIVQSGDNEKRRYNLISNQCPLHDFVIRFTIKDNGKPISFNGKKYIHKSSNICNEDIGNSIHIDNDDTTLRLELAFDEADPNFISHIYLRDEPTGLWIIHFRLKPKVCKIEYFHLRLLSRVYTGNIIPHIYISRTIGKIFYRYFPRMLDYRERNGTGRFQLTGYKTLRSQVSFTVTLS